MKFSRSLILICFCLLSSGLGRGTLRADCVTARPQIVAWWRAEGNATDSAGTDNGTLQNGASFGVGEVGQAFNFDGADDYIQLNNAAQNPFPASGFTYECWIRPNAQSASRATLISNHQTDGNWWNGISLLNQSVEVTLQNGSTGGWVAWYSTSALPINQFSHLAVAYHYSGVASNDLQIYFDGVTQVVTGTVIAGDYASGFAPGYNANDPRGLVLGRTQEDSPRGYFGGRLDELTFYDRVLSASEIQSIFNAGSTGKCPPPGAPSLTIFLTTTNTAVVLWPSPSTGFGLQQNTNSLSSVNWSNVTTTPTDNGAFKFIIVNPPIGNRFYRLFKP